MATPIIRVVIVYWPSLFKGERKRSKAVFRISFQGGDTTRHETIRSDLIVILITRINSRNRRNFTGKLITRKTELAGTLKLLDTFKLVDTLQNSRYLKSVGILN